MDAIIKSFDIGDGRTMTLETGLLAKQADGSAVIRMGNTMLLATVVSANEAREGTDFFPMTVDYQEKYAAAGRIPGGFFKREGRLGEHEIIISRLVDRALRPLAPDNYRNDTQVLISLISSDEEIEGDMLAALAASTAITLSDVPLSEPISEVRVIKLGDKYIVNPKKSETEEAELEIILAATAKNIMMVEGQSKETSEAVLIEAIKAGHEVIKIQIAAQLELAEMAGGIPTKREVVEDPENEEIKKKVEEMCSKKIYEIAAGALPKHERTDGFKAIKEELVASFGEEPDEDEVKLAKAYFKSLEKEVIRKMILEESKRLDGRKLDEVRPIWTKVDYLPAAHGSALFTRGETQSLTSMTLGGKMDEQMIDNATEKGYKRFLLQYNFPPFSTGETKPQRGPSRREIGHGNLALRSIKQVLPSEEDNPYTIRLVSDILESNGSSSMATVCASSMALMDGGVQITGGVSGIAMGMITDDSGNYAILSDILGDEDHLGDMDFKVTGTTKGICAVQMDIKIDGLSYEVMAEALEQAKAGRLHILEEMNKTISKPNETIKPHAPRIEKVFIEKEFIGAVIGPGGKVIQEMQETTGATIHIEEIDGRGEVVIMGTNTESVEKAVAMIKGLTEVPEAGEEYEATVKSIMPYGAFVEFLPGKEGLLHISEVSWERLENLDGVLKEGDSVKVKLLAVDAKTGRFKLSRKVLMPRPESASAGESREEA